MYEIIHVFLTGTFPDILQWVIHHGYPFIFTLMVFEGQATIVATSFAANLGYFNIGTIFILAFLSDLVADCLWFAVGYYGNIALVNRFGHLFKTNGRMDKIKQLFLRHPGKALAIIKCSPFITVPGTIMVGGSDISFKKFFKLISIIIVPKTIVFVSLGYFFGSAYELIRGYLQNTFFALLIIFAIAIVVFIFYKNLSVKFSNKIEDKNVL